MTSTLLYFQAQRTGKPISELQYTSGVTHGRNGGDAVAYGALDLPAVHLFPSC